MYGRKALIGAATLAIGLGVSSVASAGISDLVDELNRAFPEQGSYAYGGNGFLSEVDLSGMWQFDVKDVDVTTNGSRVRVRCRRGLTNNRRARCVWRGNTTSYRSRTFSLETSAHANHWAALVNAIAVQERESLVKSARRAVNAELADKVFMSFVDGDLCRPRLKWLPSGIKNHFVAQEVEASFVNQGADGKFIRLRCIDGSECISQPGTGRRAEVLASMNQADATNLREKLDTVRQYCS